MNDLSNGALALVIALLMAIVAGTWSTIFSLTTARNLYKKLKEAGDEPKVDLNVFSMITISIFLRRDINFWERKYPSGYFSYHNWRIIKDNATRYNIISAWIFSFFNVLFLISVGVSIAVS
jgi:hypothetical protein